jgi:predicted ATP-grasp superfamily ATP-dependent carboligase
MDHVHWSRRPALRTPVVIAAFTGWNDAGDAASSALQHLVHTWDASRFAEIDPEEFVDYQSTRPQVRLVDGTTREVVWPVTDLYSATTPGGDVVLVLGPEPQLRWRTYCRALVETAGELDASLVVTMGALLADVHHRRPVSIIGTASDAGIVERYRLQRSRYEGPTGIVGCLHDACTTAGLASLSLWAAVPAYLPGTASPKATLALVRRVSSLVGTTIEAGDLEESVAEYEQEIDEYVERDDDLQSYVERLDRLADDETDQAPSVHPAEEHGSAERLVAEVEKFLRDQGE